MKIFIKSLFTLFYILFIGATILFAANECFLTTAGLFLTGFLFGGSIRIMIDWVIKEE